MKRTRIKPKPPKYAAPGSELDLEREAWARPFDVCWICTTHSYRVWQVDGWDVSLIIDTHEIARRSQAPNRWAHPCNYFRTCRTCHEALGDYEQWPMARQLALKLLRDPGHFDLDQWRKVIGRGGDVVTWEDTRYERGIAYWLRVELIEGGRAA